ncbi:hypothetical protein GYMLUDRAFT_237852 [Collybiopsis luxurians FD-317 M1]|nr:hypothetical protein GYMLUDRAFT_237852 [Collybiopsis luxurians FD-317 M1]
MEPSSTGFRRDPRNNAPPPAYTATFYGPSTPSQPGHRPQSQPELTRYIGPRVVVDITVRTSRPPNLLYHSGPTPTTALRIPYAYYDPRSAHSLAEADARARPRFLLALLLALGIWMLCGLPVDWFQSRHPEWVKNIAECLRLWFQQVLSDWSEVWFWCGMFIIHCVLMLILITASQDFILIHAFGHSVSGTVTASPIHPVYIFLLTKKIRRTADGVGRMQFCFPSFMDTEHCSYDDLLFMIIVSFLLYPFLILPRGLFSVVEMRSRRLRSRRELLSRDIASFAFLLVLSFLVQFYTSFKGVSHDFVQAPFSHVLQAAEAQDVPRPFSTWELDMDLNCVIYSEELQHGRVLAGRSWFITEEELDSTVTLEWSVDPSIQAQLAYYPIEDARAQFYFYQGPFSSFFASLIEQALVWNIVVLLPSLRSLRGWDTPTFQAITLLGAIGMSAWYFVHYAVKALTSPCSPTSSFMFGFIVTVVSFAACAVYAFLLPLWVRDEEAMSDGGIFSLYLRLREWLQGVEDDDRDQAVSRRGRGRSREVRIRFNNARELYEVETRRRVGVRTEKREKVILNRRIVKSQPFILPT